MIDPYLYAAHEESQRTSNNHLFEKMHTRNGDDSVIDEPISDKKEANDAYSSSDAQ